MNKDAVTKVGCIVIVRRDHNILLGLRKNCYGAGTWGLPGGHMDTDERAIAAACREVAEEIGLNIASKDLKFASINDKIVKGDEERHLQIAFECGASDDFAPENLEPEYCDEWRWFDINELPENILGTHQPAIDNYRAGIAYDVEDK